MNLDYYFRYGQSLKGVQNYDEADTYLRTYFNKDVNTKAFIEKTPKQPRIVSILNKLRRIIHIAISVCPFMAMIKWFLLQQEIQKAQIIHGTIRLI